MQITIDEIHGISKNQDKSLGNIEAMQELIIQQSLREKKIETKPKEELEKPVVSEFYEKRKDICLGLLRDKNYTWRTDKILKRRSKMTDDEFEYFVNSEPGVVESLVPDAFGNRLFKLE